MSKASSDISSGSRRSVRLQENNTCRDILNYMRQGNSNGFTSSGGHPFMVKYERGPEFKQENTAERKIQELGVHGNWESGMLKESGIDPTLIESYMNLKTAPPYPKLLNYSQKLTLSSIEEWKNYLRYIDEVEHFENSKYLFIGENPELAKHAKQLRIMRTISSYSQTDRLYGGMDMRGRSVSSSMISTAGSDQPSSCDSSMDINADFLSKEDMYMPNGKPSSLPATQSPLAGTALAALDYPED